MTQPQLVRHWILLTEHKYTIYNSVKLFRDNQLKISNTVQGCDYSFKEGNLVEGINIGRRYSL